MSNATTPRSGIVCCPGAAPWRRAPPGFLQMRVPQGFEDFDAGLEARVHAACGTAIASWRRRRWRGFGLEEFLQRVAAQRRCP